LERQFRLSHRAAPRRRLAEVATQDGLTRLLDGAALEEQARSLWQHAQLARLPVSLMLIDIDRFKVTTVTAPGGDRCLREVAAAIGAAAARRDGRSLHAHEDECAGGAPAIGRQAAAERRAAELPKTAS
jgi:GGDEF domain-containing protein